MILKIQNFCEKKIPLYPPLGSLKIASQYDVNSKFDYSHTGWMDSIDLHISRQNPSIETTTSG